MISVHFQDKLFSIKVIQVYALTTKAKEAEVEWFNEDLLEKAMAPHSSTLAWEIPWMEEPGRLQSMGSLRVGLNDFASTFHFHSLEKEMATHSSILA